MITISQMKMRSDCDKLKMECDEMIKRIDILEYYEPLSHDNDECRKQIVELNDRIDKLEKSSEKQRFVSEKVLLYTFKIAVYRFGNTLYIRRPMAIM